QEVRGILDVRTNASLVDASGLGALRRVTGNVVIYNNAVLTTVSLGALIQVGASGGNSLNIQALPELVALDVGALEEVPGNVYLYQLGATADDELTMDLSALQILRGQLDVQGVANLETLDGLSGLTQVTGN